MTKTRKFKKEYAKELLRVAYYDHETAVALVKIGLPRKENILFHFQQSTEKGLNAYICWIEKPVPVVHDLQEIVRTIPNYSVIPHHDQLYDLTQFATIRRYEEGVAIITDEEVESVKVATLEVLKWVDSKINE